MLPTTWPNLFAAAKQALRDHESMTKGNNFLSLCYEPSFGDEFSLCFSWDGGRCRWERLTWEKNTDVAKFGVMEQLRYLGQTLAPTLRSASGDCDREDLQPIVARLESLTLPIRDSPDRSLILDGVTTTLTFGNATWKVSYRWTMLPPTWKGLGDVQRMLLQLAEKLEEDTEE